MPLVIACALMLATLVTAAEHPAGPLSASHEKKSFVFADPNLDIELVAAEPEVNSPVAVAWDAHGGMFVAEMSDYPNSPEKGRIKLLQDHNGDGRVDRVTVFSSELPFPNGVLPWQDGILVTAAPDIWFLSDTNADGIADKRRKILTGFAEGNQQLRVNGLTWGLDNWIYAANGRSDGEIRWADKTNCVSIRGRDLRFRLDTQQLEPIAGRSQFGLARDDWGNRFLSWNTIPIRHEVLPERYLNRNRFLATTESILDILEPGDTGRVYPRTPTPLTFNNESTTHFNALAGLAIYRGDALGPQYRGNAFVGESLRNLVHRRVLEENGPTFVARRVERETEFLASTDPWFHPVNFATGPDGALYIVDFYRQFVEHPDFVRGKAREQVQWRTGAGHGRIWRVRSKDHAQPPGTPNLSRATTAELVRQFENPNAWQRDTAQRLLIERRDSSARADLQKLVGSSKFPLARVHALFTLQGLEALEPKLVENALEDQHPRVRVAALQLAGELCKAQPASHKQLLHPVARLESDDDAPVRFQLALTIGDLTDARKHSLLARLANRDFTNRWHATAILSSLGQSPWAFLRQLLRTDSTWMAGTSPEHARFLDQTAALVGANHSDNDYSEFRSLVTSHETTPSTRFSLIAGFGDGIARGRSSDAELTNLLRSVPEIVNDAATAALEARLPTHTRLAALRVTLRSFGALANERVYDLVQRLLASDQSPELQSAAASALGQLDDAKLATTLFSQWGSYAVATRRQLLAAALRTTAGTIALVGALESGDVSILELDASIRQALQNKKAPELKASITQLLGVRADTNREQLIREFQPALALSGEPRRGAATFVRLCLPCHAIGTQGGHVGPELSAVSGRPSEVVLIDILDPSRQVAPEYLSYTVATAEDHTVTGLIVAETTANVTVRRQNQPDETIPRARIKQIRADGKSLMPEGLHDGLTKQDMADLLHFLRKMDPTLLPGN